MKKYNKVEYHEGYYAAGNNIPFDENKSQEWKDGWNDGFESIYGDTDLDINEIIK